MNRKADDFIKHAPLGKVDRAIDAKRFEAIGKGSPGTLAEEQGLGGPRGALKQDEEVSSALHYEPVAAGGELRVLQVLIVGDPGIVEMIDSMGLHRPIQAQPAHPAMGPPHRSRVGGAALHPGK